MSEATPTPNMRPPDGRDIFRCAFSLFRGYFGYVGRDFLNDGGHINLWAWYGRALTDAEIKEIAERPFALFVDRTG